MTGSSLEAALRAGTDGLYALKAAVGLIIAHGSWLDRQDFKRFIHIGDSITNPGIELAVIDWDAAIAALDAGESPGSSGEEKILRIAASLATDIPVRLGDAVTSLDEANAALLGPPRLRAAPVPSIAPAGESMNNLPTWKQIEDATLEHLNTARSAASDAALELRSDWSSLGTPLSEGPADRRDQVLKIVNQVKNLIDKAKTLIYDGRP